MQGADCTFWLLCEFKYMDASSCASRIKHNPVEDRELCGQCLMVQFVSPALSNSFCCSNNLFGIQVPFYVCNINSYACQDPKSKEPLWHLHGFHLSDVLFLSFIKCCFLSFTQNRRFPHHSYIQQRRKQVFYFLNLLQGSKSMNVIW